MDLELDADGHGAGDRIVTRMRPPARREEARTEPSVLSAGGRRVRNATAWDEASSRSPGAHACVTWMLARFGTATVFTRRIAASSTGGAAAYRRLVGR